MSKTYDALVLLGQKQQAHIPLAQSLSEEESVWQGHHSWKSAGLKIPENVALQKI